MRIVVNSSPINSDKSDWNKLSETQTRAASTKMVMYMNMTKSSCLIIHELSIAQLDSWYSYGRELCTLDTTIICIPIG